MKNKSVFILIAVTLIILVGGVFLFTKGSSGGSNGTSLSSPTDYEYYWSKTCPHCANVNEFMEGWANKDKVKIEKYEINETKENTLRFLDRGDFCQIPKNQLGVPLLITPKGICLSGDRPIIDHFKNLTF